MKKIILTLGALFFIATSFAQKNINNYKYVVVPKQYEFQKSADEHQINSLTKFLLERAGFTAFLSDEKLPVDLAKNPCLALKAKVINNSGIFSTKTKVQLLNCKNEVVFVTKEGKTKEKNYKKAYHKAIRKAFADIEALRYKYDDKTTVVKRSNAKDLLRIDRGIIKENEKIYKTSDEVSKETKSIKNTRDLTSIDGVPITKEEKVYVSSVKSIGGKYQFPNWGICKIVKENKEYKAFGGTENFNFAILYPTSKANLYIIKYIAFKEPKLVEVLPNGNLKIDQSEQIIKKI